MSCGESRTVILVSPQRVTTSGELDLLLSVDTTGFKEGSITLVVLSVEKGGGAPTLTGSIRTADINDSAYFTTLPSFSAATDPGAEMLYNTEFGKFLTVKWTLAAGGGTNVAFVFTVVGTLKA